jgi:YaiO family outer membrane protein
VVALVVLLAAAPIARAQTPAPVAAVLRREAQQLRREQRLPEALAAYRAVVALEPGGFEDRFWVAKLESWTGRLEDAEDSFMGLVAERPDDYDSRIALADVRRWRGRIAAAREVLEDLRRTHPDDPEVLQRLDALRRVERSTRWDADLGYFGERLPGGSAANGAALSLGASLGHGLRWRTAAMLQEKFGRTEARAGGELGLRFARWFEVAGSAYLAPGALVMPRETYGLGLSRKLGRRLVLDAGYAFLSYRDAQVHRVGPGLEWYAGRWLLAGRYRYTATRFDGAAAAVDDHSGSLSVGYLYGSSSSLVRIFAAAGGESFTQPSRELIGRFDAHAVGLAWRHFLTPNLGVEALYAHQDRSDGRNQDSYSVRVLRQW